jgi:hypothetical protein
MQCGEEDDLGGPNVYIYSIGFKELYFVYIFLNFIQIYMNFGSLDDFSRI